MKNQDKQIDCGYEIINLTAGNYSLYIKQLVKTESETFAEAWTENAYINDICKNDKAFYTAVVRGGTLIAYANFWYIDGVGNINNVAVVPEFRGCGFGAILMKALIERCRQLGGRAMTLEVRESNTAAVCLYEKLGFESRGIRPNYYADNHEGAVIMWLSRKS